MARAIVAAVLLAAVVPSTAEALPKYPTGEAIFCRNHGGTMTLTCVKWGPPAPGQFAGPCITSKWTCAKPANIQ